MRALKMRSIVTSHHRSWSSYNYMRSCWRTQCWSFYSCFALEANWKVKKLDKWVTHELTKNQKFILKRCLLLLHATVMNYFLIKLSRETKSVKKRYSTIGDGQLSGWTKKLQSASQSQSDTKKWPWSLFGGLLSIWSTTAFWILVKSLHLRGMFS